MCPQAHIICPQGHTSLGEADIICRRQTSLGEADIICPQGKHHSKKKNHPNGWFSFWQVAPKKISLKSV